ncbi:MAG: suppressor of fused domain protein [Clostridia bacterium]|nr:suppressor of fused domain protein [Clostridia bacterium]
MNTRQMDKFTDHCAKFFDQEPMIMHTESHMDMHVDVLLFEPNEKYPFWKLVTMGASDYKMPKTEFSLGDRNEYMMFVDADEDLTDRFVVDWYYQQLMNIALMPYKEKFAVSYGHSMEWELEDGEEMCAACAEELEAKNSRESEEDEGWKDFIDEPIDEEDDEDEMEIPLEELQDDEFNDTFDDEEEVEEYKEEFEDIGDVDDIDLDGEDEGEEDF